MAAPEPAARRLRPRAPVERAANANQAFATALFEELVRAGIRHACVCPGSRSAPLAAAAAHAAGLRAWSQIDERAAGFFALGLAKASRAPVALVCTSGTAAANLLPAVVEACYARVPLVVVTADRPQELREWDAGQTIDQVRLYGSHVRWFAEAPVPELAAGDDGAAARLLRHARALAARAVAAARGPVPGPVHVNLPMREPLAPLPLGADAFEDLGDRDAAAAAGRAPAPYTDLHEPAREPTPHQLAALAELVARHPRGVVACGPMDATPELCEAIARLGRAAGWPVLADPTAQLRRGPHLAAGPLVACSDLFLRDERFAERHAPEVVLRFGAAPISKPLRRWLERHRPAHAVVVDAEGGWSDPSHLASALLRADPLALCERLARRLEGVRSAGRPASPWLEAFLRADARAAAAIDRTLAGEALLSAAAVRELAEALPADACLYVSNSMPVRELDAFLPPSERSLRVLVNRGANGIDGMLSSALGAAAAGDAPVVLLTGDLAFLHDAGGLLAAHRHGLRLVVVVLNNDGGGIFSYLPIAAYGEAVAFEAQFRTPHGLALGGIAQAYGARYERADGAAALREALARGLAAPATTVIEVPIDRDRDVAQHRAVERAVRAALAEGER